MEFTVKEFYIYTPSGDALLVEIFEESNTINIMFAGRRLQITKDSAYDLADALLMVGSDI